MTEARITGEEEKRTVGAAARGPEKRKDSVKKLNNSRSHTRLR